MSGRGIALRQSYSMNCTAHLVRCSECDFHAGRKNVRLKVKWNGERRVLCARCSVRLGFMPEPDRIIGSLPGMRQEAT